MIGIQPLIAQVAEPPVTLTVGGAVIMALSVGMVLALLGFCMHRIMRDPQAQEHHHAPLDIDTHDGDR